MKKIYYLFSMSYFMARLTSYCKTTQNKFKIIMQVLVLQSSVVTYIETTRRIKESPALKTATHYRML